MVEGADEHEKSIDHLRWNATFATIAAISNTTRTKKADLQDPLTFFPYREELKQAGAVRGNGIRLTRENVCDVLGALFGAKPQ